MTTWTHDVAQTAENLPPEATAETLDQQYRAARRFLDLRRAEIGVLQGRVGTIQAGLSDGRGGTLDRETWETAERLLTEARDAERSALIALTIMERRRVAFRLRREQAITDERARLFREKVRRMELAAFAENADSAVARAKERLKAQRDRFSSGAPKWLRGALDAAGMLPKESAGA